MKTSSVNIDFGAMAVAFRKHVLNKALKVGGTVAYMKNGKLIEEDPRKIEAPKDASLVH